MIVDIACPRWIWRGGVFAEMGAGRWDCAVHLLVAVYLPRAGDRVR